MMHGLRALIVFGLLLVMPAIRTIAAENVATPTAKETTQRFNDGLALLDKLYWSPALGIWLDRPGDDLRAHYDGRRNPPWWPSANAVELLIDFMNATGSRAYDERIAALYVLQKDRPKRTTRVVAELKRRKQWTEADEERLKRREQEAAARKPDPHGHYTDFQNEYLDDSGWWALTWLKMYDRTRDAKYLATAKTIHAHMAKNWRPDKGGGILWCEDADKQRPNAITNNLFLILSARLHTRTKEASYLDWAEKTLAWIREKALYDGTGVVDAPGHRGDYWSYNQGTFIGGLTALHEATGKPEYLDEAVEVTDAVLTKSGMTRPDGVIVEKLGTSGDASLFKGIFARYLAQLRDTLNAKKLHPETAQQLDHHLRASVASLLQHSVGADGLLTAEWHEGGKDRAANFNTQTSALAALVAVLPRL
jgi:predicted alpha-1,6-mannanase (GH76 family)